jgi:hypothetical protein
MSRAVTRTKMGSYWANRFVKNGLLQTGFTRFRLPLKWPGYLIQGKFKKKGRENTRVKPFFFLFFQEVGGIAVPTMVNL